MTTTSEQAERGDLLEDAAPETITRLAGLEALSDTPIPAPLPAPASGPVWNCLQHVPGGSVASWIAECLSFGGRRRRLDLAQAAYDAIWARREVGERADEPVRT